MNELSYDMQTSLFSDLPDGQFIFLLCEENYLNTHSFSSLLQSAKITAKPGEKKLIAYKSHVLCLIGIGKNEQNNPSNMSKYFGKILTEIKEQKLENVYFDFLLAENTALENYLVPFSEILTLGLYSFSYQYDSKLFEQKSHPALKNIYFLCHTKQEQAQNQKSIEQGFSQGQNINLARLLSDLPSNQLTPEDLAQFIKKDLKQFKHVKSTILDEKDLEEQKFGGILAVGKGSINKPVLGIYEYTPKKFTKTILIVGKGVTFDTGGYSLKSKKNHNDMKYDMCGAANCFAAFKTLVSDQIPVKLILILPCVENTIGDQAERPGDVYRAWNGKLVDVYNTDAEGRLILADAISYGTTTYKPDYCLDMATLTGGTTQIAASMAGILCANEQAENEIKDLKKLARSLNEPMLHLEILPEAAENLKGNVSDYTNMHNKWGEGAATMYAAAFLKSFLVGESVKWIHFDIANMAYAPKYASYLNGQNASGFGARTLREFIKILDEKRSL